MEVYSISTFQEDAGHEALPALFEVLPLEAERSLVCSGWALSIDIPEQVRWLTFPLASLAPFAHSINLEVFVLGGTLANQTQSSCHC